MNIRIKLVEAIEVYPLRQKVLRPGRTYDERVFDGDELDSTFHVAAINEENVIGVASMMKRKLDAFPDVLYTYQLRGMAVDPVAQGEGIGRQMILFSERFLRKLIIRYLWFNARVSAVAFYQKMGYTKLGDEFEVPEIGTHIKMYKEL